MDSGHHVLDLSSSTCISVNLTTRLAWEQIWMSTAGDLLQGLLEEPTQATGRYTTTEAACLLQPLYRVPQGENHHWLNWLHQLIYFLKMRILLGTEKMIQRAEAHVFHGGGRVWSPALYMYCIELSSKQSSFSPKMNFLPITFFYFSSSPSSFFSSTSFFCFPILRIHMHIKCCTHWGEKMPGNSHLTSSAFWPGCL